ncbi:MAG: peptidylprolyl isomerase [bacterium]
MRNYTMIKYTRILLAGLAITLIGAAVSTAQVMDRPAATVNYTKSEIITQKQLDLAVSQIGQQYSMMGQPNPSRGEVLEEILIQKLIIQAARKENIQVSEGEVKSALRAQLGPEGVNITDEQLKLLVRQQTGMSWTDYLQQGKEQLLTQNYIKFKKQELFEDIKEPTESEIREIYNENQHLFINPEMVRFGQIYRDTRNLSASEKNRARDLMEEILADLRSGKATFDEMVMKYSDDTQSRYKGGDVGFLAINDKNSKQLLGKDFFDAAFSTPEGKTTGIIESNIGLHILHISEKLSARLLGLNDPVNPSTTETVRDRIVNLKLLEKQQVLFQQAVGEIINDLKRLADIRIYSDNADIDPDDLKYFENSVR